LSEAGGPADRGRNSREVQKIKKLVKLRHAAKECGAKKIIGEMRNKSKKFLRGDLGGNSKIQATSEKARTSGVVGVIGVGEEQAAKPWKAHAVRELKNNKEEEKIKTVVQETVFAGCRPFTTNQEKAENQELIAGQGHREGEGLDK